MTTTSNPPQRLRDRGWVVRDPRTFGHAIAFFRRSSGATQAELADSTNLTRQYVSGLERGDVTQQLDRLFRVVRELGLEVEVRPRR